MGKVLARMPLAVMVSKKIAAIRLSIEQAANCTHDILIASTVRRPGEKNPIQMTCSAQKTDPARTSRSPLLILKSCVTLKKYVPQMARTVPAQVSIPYFCFINRPKRGTWTTYIPVKKPALPAVVEQIPSCCR